MAASPLLDVGSLQQARGGQTDACLALSELKPQ